MLVIVTLSFFKSKILLSPLNYLAEFLHNILIFTKIIDLIYK